MMSHEFAGVLGGFGLTLGFALIGLLFYKLLKNIDNEKEPSCWPVIWPIIGVAVIFMVLVGATGILGR